jgi:hypothetical protein
MPGNGASPIRTTIMSLGNNARIVAAANRMGFTINLSANNLAHADELAPAIAPVA